MKIWVEHTLCLVTDSFVPNFQGFRIIPIMGNILDTNNIAVFVVRVSEWNRSSVNSMNSGNLITEALIGVNLKVLSLTCVLLALVATWSLTQEVAGFIVMTNIFSYWIQWIQWKYLEKTQNARFLRPLNYDHNFQDQELHKALEETDTQTFHHSLINCNNRTLWNYDFII